MKSPLEAVKALRMLFSIIGPNTSPNTSGAKGYSCRARTIPITPKATSRIRSKVLIWTA